MIWAQAHDGIIGSGGSMPWHVPEDLEHFKATTLGHPVIMGRATWGSLTPRFRPLPGRPNVVLTRSADAAAQVRSAGAHPAASLTEGLELIADTSDIAWIMGGGQVYREAEPLADVAVVTELDLTVDGDTTAPVLGASWAQVSRSEWATSCTGVPYRILRYERTPDVH